MKILLLAHGIDTRSFGEIRLPLAPDVPDPEAWYYPFVRYAMTASMLSADNSGLLKPNAGLTRGDTARMLYHFLLYRDSRRNQDLLSKTERELRTVIDHLDAGSTLDAGYASARALLLARGAHFSLPNEDITQGALKIAEAFRALVRATVAFENKDYSETVRLCGDAWNLAGRGRQLNDKLFTISKLLQTMATQRADDAREEIEAIEAIEEEGS